MNMWTTLVPDQRITHKPTPRVKDQSAAKEKARQKAMEKAEIRAQASRARREAKQAAIAKLRAMADPPAINRAKQIAALEDKRIELGLMKKEFAIVLGISRQHYSALIRGERQLYLAYIRRAFALGIPADVLLGVR